MPWSPFWPWIPVGPSGTSRPRRTLRSCRAGVARQATNALVALSSGRSGRTLRARRPQQHPCAPTGRPKAKLRLPEPSGVIPTVGVAPAARAVGVMVPMPGAGPTDSSVSGRPSRTLDSLRPARTDRPSDGSDVVPRVAVPDEPVARVVRSCGSIVGRGLAHDPHVARCGRAWQRRRAVDRALDRDARTGVTLVSRRPSRASRPCVAVRSSRQPEGEVEVACAVRRNPDSRRRSRDQTCRRDGPDA